MNKCSNHNLTKPLVGLVFDRLHFPPRYYDRQFWISSNYSHVYIIFNPPHQILWGTHILSLWVKAPLETPHTCKLLNLLWPHTGFHFYQFLTHMNFADNTDKGSILKQIEVRCWNWYIDISLSKVLPAKKWYIKIWYIWIPDICCASDP